MKKIILFISKLLLLGKSSPLKLGLSVAFGLLIAFVPLSPLSLTTVILFILLLVLNLNIRVSLAGFVLFMLLSVLLEPLMVIIGSFILEDIAFLQPVWITLRSIPLFPLTRFYNTTVTGGFTLALVLFIPVTLLTSFLFSKMKKGLNDKEDKKSIPKPVKLINLALILLIPIIVIILNFVFLPKFVKDSIQKYGSRAVGAKVELERVNINFFNTTVFLYGLQVTNPGNTMKNIVSVDDIKFKMNPLALLEAKADIEIIEIKNMLFNTDRKTDGRLADSPGKEQTTGPGETKETSKELFNQDFLENMENFDVESFLKENIKTTAKIMALQEKSLKDLEKWRKEVENFNYHNDLKEVYDQVQGLNINTDSFSIEDIQKIEQLISTINSSQKKVKNIVNDFQAKQKSLRQDITGTGNAVINIRKEAEAEFQGLLQKMNIGNIDARSLSKLVLSDQINSYVEKGYYWLYKIRSIVPEKKASAKEEKTKRKKERSFGSAGYDVHFPNRNARPDFHIRKVLISANEKLLDSRYPGITGEAAHISSDQDITGNPISAGLNLKLPMANAGTARLELQFDRRNNRIIDTYRITLDNYTLENIPLLGTGGLPSKINKAGLGGEGSVKVLTNRDVEATMSLDLHNVNFEFKNSESPGIIGEIISDIFASIENLEFIITALRKNEQTELTLDSNLDSLLQDRLSALFTKKVKELQEKLEKEFYGIIDAKQKEALNLIKAKQKEALGMLEGKQKEFLQEQGNVEKLLSKQLGMLDNKKNDLNKLIEQQTKEIENKLQEELGDQLDNFPNPF